MTEVAHVKQARIVIVESQGIDSHELQHLVNSLGHLVVSIANTGEQTIERVLIDQPDLVITGVKLNGLIKTGVATADYLRERIMIPIIILTTENEAGTILHTREARAVWYLTLPLQDAMFVATIDSALQEKAAYKAELATKDKVLHPTIL